MSSEEQHNRSEDSSDSPYPDVLLDHNYDGIQEYDNPMPGWWKAIFLGTIVWSGIYVVGIEWGWIDKYEDDLEDGMSELAEIRAGAAEGLPEVNEELLLAAAEDPARIESGQSVYKVNCSACHGQKGEGLVGPNLADKYWVHGGDIMSIYQTVENGVPAKGMPEWGTVLPQEDLVAVTAYMRSIQGTEPEGAKPPEGEPHEL